jgi:hypothetical protein
MQIAVFLHFVIVGETICNERFFPQPRYSADRID